MGPDEPPEQPASAIDGIGSGRIAATDASENKVPQYDASAINSTDQHDDDQLYLDAECERLLRNAKKQVKQMMEEAVTKKFIHEENSSIISLCVAVDACLSHGLKRRTLGLFKTNSSTALVQKVAKYCPGAREVLRIVEDEERRQLKECQQQSQARPKQSSKQLDEFQAARALLANGTAPNSVNSLLRQHQQNQQNTPTSAMQQSSILNSSKNLHKRHSWLKFALIEKKLVEIVEYLADNATKYYDNDAMMANQLAAQLLCSLLVGACALEFSRSKTNDYYQFEEPSADELLRRHKLSNPIACLCAHAAPSGSSSQSSQRSCSTNHLARRSVSLAQQNQFAVGRSLSSTSAGRSSTSSSSNSQQQQQQQQQQHEQLVDGCAFLCNDDTVAAGEPGSSPTTGAHESRRRPLALRTNLATGALVTDCHHNSCKEIAEHQLTRGYSFKCKTSASLALADGQQQQAASSTGAVACSQSLGAGGCAQPPAPSAATTTAAPVTCGAADQSHGAFSLWSPRMLHETLHQNSKSSLLYAKNNVLLETQTHGLMAGYLSLHQTSCDLVIKWIPNQLINGGGNVAGSLQGERGAPAGAATSTPDAASDATPRSRSLDGHGQARACCQLDAPQANGQQQRQQTREAVGSQYLDLVVSLSVARIVLMHCHFVALQATRSEECFAEGQRAADSAALSSSAEQADMAPGRPARDTTETLILVEADGVQRAPFKFPKGGLRWFLSCLENGLHPERYLELAIKPDGLADWPWADDDAIGPHAQQQQQRSSSSLTSSACSEPSSSRLDSLLRRLPSLKNARRLAEAKPRQSSAGDAQAAPPRAQQSPVGGELAASQRQAASATLNYVYRIVCVQQHDWSLATPTTPHSALSATSSSPFSADGCGLGAAANGHAGWSRLRAGEQLAAHHQSEPLVSGQRFRWSLSRLARFSTRHSSSASSAGSLAADQRRAGSTLAPGNGESGPSLADDSASMSVEASSAGGDAGERARARAWIAVSATSEPLWRDNSSELVRIEAKLDRLNRSSSRDELRAARDQSLLTLCESMRKQILARAFYGWLAHCRRARIIRTHLLKLLRPTGTNAADGAAETGHHLVVANHLIDPLLEPEKFELARRGLSAATWNELMARAERAELDRHQLSVQVNQLVYYGGIESDELRAQVWPYLLGHYDFCDSLDARRAKDAKLRQCYESQAREWAKIECTVKQRDNELLAANMAKAERRKRQQQQADAGRGSRRTSEAATTTATSTTSGDDETARARHELRRRRHSSISDWQEQAEPHDHDHHLDQVQRRDDNQTEQEKSKPRLDQRKQRKQQLQQRRQQERRYRLESTGSVGSDASITDQFGNNVHRIDKDVQRCDRHYWYFKDIDNLNKLRNIMCSYVWQHLDVGYVQGMCDLAAPFLVIFNDEYRAFCCFNQLMKRMVSNFPHGNAMDEHFENLKYLMQVLDPKLFEVLQKNGDYTHFYFCYRWLLLDFKRELTYQGVYRVWETIWSARRLVSDRFVVFLALAMVRHYRDIIIENNMDFTDTIKFFNEIAERHDVNKIIELAQDSVVEMQNLIRS